MSMQRWLVLSGLLAVAACQGPFAPLANDSEETPVNEIVSAELEDGQIVALGWLDGGVHAPQDQDGDSDTE